RTVRQVSGMNSSARPQGSERHQTNPFFDVWSAPFAVPPFRNIKPEHFPAALAWTMREHAAEIEAIASHAEPPTFANTIDSLERSGEALDRVAGVFHALASAHTNAELQKVEREITPRLAAHYNAILQNERLFRRIETLYARHDQLGL